MPVKSNKTVCPTRKEDLQRKQSWQPFSELGRFGPCVSTLSWVYIQDLNVRDFHKICKLQLWRYDRIQIFMQYWWRDGRSDRTIRGPVCDWCRAAHGALGPWRGPQHRAHSSLVVWSNFASVSPVLCTIMLNAWPVDAVDKKYILIIKPTACRSCAC